MSMTPGSSALEIMTLREVRDANAAGAGVVVLDGALERALWGNDAGLAVLGLSGRSLPDVLSAILPAARQLRTAARMIAGRHQTRLLLRSAAGLNARPLVAEVRLVGMDDAPLILVSIADMRRTAENEAALAARLLRESGVAGAAIFGEAGQIAGSEGSADVDQADIAAFLASGERSAALERPGIRTLLDRVSDNLVVVRQELTPAGALAEAVEEAQTGAISVSVPGEAEDGESRGLTGGFFSVKRRKLAPGRGETSMSALVQRWHSRRTDETGDVPMTVPAAEAAEILRPDSALESQGPADTGALVEPSPSSGNPTAQTAYRASESGDLSADAAVTDASVERSTLSQSTAPVSLADALADDVQGTADEQMPTARMHSVWGAPATADPLESKAPPVLQDALSVDIAVPDETAHDPLPEVGPPAAPDASRSPDEAVADADDVTDGDADEDRLATTVMQPADLTGHRDEPADCVALADEIVAVTAEEAATNIPDVVTSSNQDRAEPRIPEAPLELLPLDPGTETAQPIDEESITILPDIPQEEHTDLDRPIFEDEETPDHETLVPGDDEISIAPVDETGLAEETMPTDENRPLEESGFASQLGTASADMADGGTHFLIAATDVAALDGEVPAGSGMPDDETGNAIEAGDVDQAGEVDDLPAASPSRPGFVPRFDIAPVRFVWQIDRDGQFRTLSAEFAAAVGPRAADVLGRSFRQVADVFGFDGGGEIGRLLDRRDTWSGRSILWPVEGSDRKVPVDLAALPVYARDRSFDGFRGFGIVKMNEFVTDPEALGLLLADDAVAADAPAHTQAETTTPTTPEAAGNDAPAPLPVPEPPADKPILRTFTADARSTAFGRRQEPPRPQSEDEASADAEGLPKVIRLEERRRPKEGVLSQAEEAAFRAIGMKLGSQSEVESPGALRFDDPERVSEVPQPVAVEEASDDALSGMAGVDDATAGEPASQADAAAPYDVSSPDGEEFGVLADMPSHDDAADSSPSDPDERALDAEEADLDEASADDADMGDEIEAIFGSLPLAVLVQTNHRLVYANREFSQLTGYGAVEDLEASGGLGRLFAERDGEVEAGEVTLRGADGEIFDVSVHLQRVTLGGRSCLLMSFAPNEVAVQALQAMPFEATNVEAPEADDLRQQVEELQAVLDTATDGVVLLDPAGAIRAMNGSAHALFGLGQEEHAGRHVSSLFAQESQKSVFDYLEMLRDEGLAGILNDGREVIGRVAQGGFIPLFITLGRLSGERGWCVVIRDIAHWKRIEEDLVNARRQAEAASLHKSRFLANISHELRTPLNAIIGFADVMASECFGPIGNERYLEYLGDIKRSGHHVLDLVNDLLDISKIEAGKLELAFEAVSLNEVVSEVVALMQPQANRERVIVRSNLPASVPPVVADRRTMRQIALNLVANAIRFTPAGGQIIASTTYTAEGDVLLRFRDSGIGMTEREIEIALTPFQQVHAPSANRGEGTGLGLPLTKAMVEANRAQFAINSTPGEGTLVEISFPSQRVLAD